MPKVKVLPPLTDDYGNTPRKRARLIKQGKCFKHHKKGCKKCR